MAKRKIEIRDAYDMGAENQIVTRRDHTGGNAVSETRNYTPVSIDYNSDEYTYFVQAYNSLSSKEKKKLQNYVWDAPAQNFSYDYTQYGYDYDPDLLKSYNGTPYTDEDRKTSGLLPYSVANTYKKTDPADIYAAIKGAPSVKIQEKILEQENYEKQREADNKALASTYEKYLSEIYSLYDDSGKDGLVDSSAIEKLLDKYTADELFSKKLKEQKSDSADKYFDDSLEIETDPDNLYNQWRTARVDEQEKLLRNKANAQANISAVNEAQKEKQTVSDAYAETDATAQNNARTMVKAQVDALTEDGVIKNGTLSDDAYNTIVQNASAAGIDKTLVDDVLASDYDFLPAEEIQQQPAKEAYAPPESTMSEEEIKAAQDRIISSRQALANNKNTSQIWGGFGASMLEETEKFDYINDIGTARSKMQESYGNPYMLYDNLSNEERDEYNRIFVEFGEDEADKYLDSLTDTLNQREGSANAKTAEEDGLITKGLVAFLSGIDQTISGVRKWVTGTDETKSSISYAADEVYKNIDSNVGKFLFKSTTVLGGMVPGIAVSAITGGLGAAGAVASAAGAAVLGAGSGGNAYAEALGQGYSAEEAVKYGLLVGASEAALQYVLGGVGKVSSGLTSKIGAKTISNINSGLLRATAKLGGKMFSEGSEEYLQEILDPVFRNVAFGEDNAFEIYTPEAIEAFVMGAFTAGIFDGVGTFMDTGQYSNTGKAISASGGTDALIEYATYLDKDSKAYKIADEMQNGKLKATDHNVGELYAEVMSDIYSRHDQRIDQQMQESGITQRDVENIGFISQTIGNAVDKLSIQSSLPGQIFNESALGTISNGMNMAVSEYGSDNVAKMIDAGIQETGASLANNKIAKTVTQNGSLPLFGDGGVFSASLDDSGRGVAGGLLFTGIGLSESSTANKIAKSMIESGDFSADAYNRLADAVLVEEQFPATAFDSEATKAAVINTLPDSPVSQSELQKAYDTYASLPEYNAWKTEADILQQQYAEYKQTGIVSIEFMQQIHKTKALRKALDEAGSITPQDIEQANRIMITDRAYKYKQNYLAEQQAQQDAAADFAAEMTAQQAVQVQALEQDAQGAETATGAEIGANSSYNEVSYSPEALEENIRTVSEMEPVATLTGKEFPKSKKGLVEQVGEYFESLNNFVHNDELGDVVLNKRSIRDSMAHGLGRNKVAAFMSVPNVIENGKVIDYQENWKQRGYDTVVMAAPISINQEQYIQGVIVVKESNKNRYYLHEVLLEKKGETSFWTGTTNNSGTPGDASNPSLISILQKVQNINENIGIEPETSPVQAASQIAQEYFNPLNDEQNITSLEEAAPPATSADKQAAEALKADIYVEPDSYGTEISEEGHISSFSASDIIPGKMYLINGYRGANVISVKDGIVTFREVGRSGETKLPVENFIAAYTTHNKNTAQRLYEVGFDPESNAGLEQPFPGAVMKELIRMRAENGIDTGGRLNDNTMSRVKETLEGFKKKSAIVTNSENIFRIFDDSAATPEDAKYMKATYVTPMLQNDYRAVRWVNEWKQKIDGLKLSKKESAATQEYAENRKIAMEILEAGLDVNKIKNAASVFRAFYDESIELMNRSLSRNGYNTVQKRNNYMPHFTEEISSIGKFLNKVRAEDLPKEISGITETFKPGKKWFGNLLPRLGDSSTMDAIEGFNRYIQNAASVIFHTDDIQRFRQLEASVSSDETQNQSLSNFSAFLHDYTNDLAGKKIGRSGEKYMGRVSYTMSDMLLKRFSANAVAGNLATAFSNFIPLSQAAGQMDVTSLMRGLGESAKNMFINDGFSEGSTFLTTRFADKYRVTARGTASRVLDKGTQYAMSLFEGVDKFVAEGITRGAYYDGIKQGMSDTDAMAYADELSTKIMANRTYGMVPLWFRNRNPVVRAAMQFQLEAPNAVNNVIKDIPRQYRGNSGKIVFSFLKWAIAAYLVNDLLELVTGRRPGLDPVGIAKNAVEDYSGSDTGKATANLLTGIVDQLPIVSILTGGRFPVVDAVPDATVSALFDAGVVETKDLLSDADSLVLNFLTPFAGAQIKKTTGGLSGILGINTPGGLQTVTEGGSYVTNEDGERILQYPVEQSFGKAVQGTIFGRSSLSETQDYYDGGKSLSAKATETFDALSAEGIDRQKMYNVYQEMRQQSNNAGKMEVIAKSDFTTDEKFKLINGFVTEIENKNQIIDKFNSLVDSESTMKQKDASSEAEKAKIRRETEQRKKAFLELWQ
jgi:hypothetical protein